MRPVTFACHETLLQSPGQIAEQILDLANWTDFQGYGLIPGIRTAEFVARTPQIVGTRIQVTNRDGSSHVEEIVEWWPESRIQLRMGDFSPPLSRLATHFVETWDFLPNSNGTVVTRAFALYAKSLITKPLLWLIAFGLKQAIARHLRLMRTR